MPRQTTPKHKAICLELRTLWLDNISIFTLVELNLYLLSLAEVIKSRRQGILQGKHITCGMKGITLLDTILALA